MRLDDLDGLLAHRAEIAAIDQDGGDGRIAVAQIDGKALGLEDGHVRLGSAFGPRQCEER